MKVTREIPILIEKENKKLLEELDRLMAVFSSAIRYAFNRLLEGETKGKLIKIVNVNFHLNKRYAEDAVLFAQSIKYTECPYMRQLRLSLQEGEWTLKKRFRKNCWMNFSLW